MKGAACCLRMFFGGRSPSVTHSLSPSLCVCLSLACSLSLSVSISLCSFLEVWYCIAVTCCYLRSCNISHSCEKTLKRKQNWAGKGERHGWIESKSRCDIMFLSMQCANCIWLFLWHIRACYSDQKNFGCTWFIRLVDIIIKIKLLNDFFSIICYSVQLGLGGVTGYCWSENSVCVCERGEEIM